MWSDLRAVRRIDLDAKMRVRDGDSRWRMPFSPKAPAANGREH